MTRIVTGAVTLALAHQHPPQHDCLWASASALRLPVCGAASSELTSRDGDLRRCEGLLQMSQVYPQLHRSCRRRCSLPAPSAQAERTVPSRACRLGPTCCFWTGALETSNTCLIFQGGTDYSGTAPCRSAFSWAGVRARTVTPQAGAALGQPYWAVAATGTDAGSHGDSFSRAGNRSLEAGELPGVPRINLSSCRGMLLRRLQGLCLPVRCWASCWGFCPSPDRGGRASVVSLLPVCHPTAESTFLHGGKSSLRNRFWKQSEEVVKGAINCCWPQGFVHLSELVSTADVAAPCLLWPSVHLHISEGSFACLVLVYL